MILIRAPLALKGGVVAPPAPLYPSSPCPSTRIWNSWSNPVINGEKKCSFTAQPFFFSCSSASFRIYIIRINISGYIELVNGTSALICPVSIYAFSDNGYTILGIFIPPFQQEFFLSLSSVKGSTGQQLVGCRSMRRPTTVFSPCMNYWSSDACFIIF